LITVLTDASNIYYGRTNLSDGSGVSGTFAVTPWDQKASSSDPEWPSKPFVKLWKSGPDTKKRQLLFCRHSLTTNNKFNWHVGALQITGLDGKEEFKWNQTLLSGNGTALRSPAADPFSKIRSSCFLVSQFFDD
jgi:hypothetical protein